jgi:hypothetical protein
MSTRHLLSLVLLAVVVGAGSAHAGGPLVLFDPTTRTPLAYPDTVRVYTDLGPNGVLSNDESDTLVARAFAQWSSVPSSSFEAVVAGEILLGGVPTDITVANFDSVITLSAQNLAYNGGGIHVIYDTNGSIISALGAPPGVLGIASPEFSEDNSPELLESWVIINGAYTDPADTSPIPGAAYGGVYTHEIGHAINLAHSETNGAIIFPFGDDNGAADCTDLGGSLSVSHIETMYPFIDPSPGDGSGLDQSTVDQIDDMATLSDLYPGPGWPASHGTITGRILMPDSLTGVTGVNVIARNLADPLGDTNSALSGDYTQGKLGPDGLFTLHGLTPGAQYVLYADKIEEGGFSTPPTDVAFFEEYWNGVNESGDIEADTACAYVPITVAAGSPATADILLNVDPSFQILALGNTGGIPVELPFSFPFCGTSYDTAWVDADGFLTFGGEDPSTGLNPSVFLTGLPRITGIWSDLTPGDGGTVSTRVVDGNFVVSYKDVAEYLFGGPGVTNTFSITLRPDGTHAITTETLSAALSLVGRTPGGGVPDPGPIDLSTAPQPLGTSDETVYQAFIFDLDIANYTLEFDPCGAVTAVSEPGVTPPAAALLQSRPNPFRSATAITFDLPEAGPVQLRVFDVRGRLVRTIEDGEMEPGRYKVAWDGRNDRGIPLGPGIYFYRLDTPSFRATRKAVRVR